MEIQKTPEGQNNIEKENRGGEIPLPNFRQYYKATVIKTLQYWLNRHTDQWKMMENSESYTFGQLINDKEARIDNGEKTVFKRRCWENWTATGRRVKLEHL